MPDTDIVTLAKRYRARLDAQDEAALKRLADAYGLMYARLEARVDALLLEIEREGITTAAKVTQLARYKALMRDIEREMSQYSAFLRTEVALGANRGITAGLSDSAGYLKALGVTAGSGALAVNAVRTLLGFLGENSALWDRIKVLTGTQAERVRQALVDGIGLGFNPRKVARMIQDAFGQGLTDALRMARTVNLWAYRESARANYNVNADVVGGWIWWAELDDVACMSCVAQHGTLHDLDETLDDHHNGRCAAIPYVPGVNDDLLEASGESWFKEQSEEKQLEMMGPGKYDAWKGGAFEFSELSRQVENDVYGTMHTETPLWVLLGAEPPLRTSGGTGE